MRTPRRQLHSTTTETLKESILFGRPIRLSASVTLVVLLVCVVVLSGCAAGFSPAGEGTLRTETIPAPLAPSTRLPDIGILQHSLEVVRKNLESNHDGEIYSGAVEGTEPDDFAIVVTTIDGQTAATGDSEKLFPFMSVSKPFTYALTLEQHGLDVIAKVGVPAKSGVSGAVLAVVPGWGAISATHHASMRPVTAYARRRQSENSCRPGGCIPSIDSSIPVGER